MDDKKIFRLMDELDIPILESLCHIYNKESVRLGLYYGLNCLIVSKILRSTVREAACNVAAGFINENEDLDSIIFTGFKNQCKQYVLEKRNKKSKRTRSC